MNDFLNKENYFFNILQKINFLGSVLIVSHKMWISIVDKGKGMTN